jgi:hypothetical protein
MNANVTIHFRPSGEVAFHELREGVMLLDHLIGAAACVYMPYHYFPVKRYVCSLAAPLTLFAPWLPMPDIAATGTWSGN